ALDRPVERRAQERDDDLELLEEHPFAARDVEQRLERAQEAARVSRELRLERRQQRARPALERAGRDRDGPLERVLQRRPIAGERGRPAPLGRARWIERRARP